MHLEGERPHTSGTAAASARLALALLTAAFAGCGAEPSVRTLRIATYAPPSTLDPHHHAETASSAVLCNVYDGLVAMSPTMGIEPALALSWEHLDATHLRLSLRPGVKFHSGAPFSSADVVATWRRTLRDPRCRMRHYLNGVSDMRADGELGVIVETADAVPDLLARLAFLSIVPTADTELEEIVRPVGTGAYRWESTDADGSVELRAWRGWRGEPGIGRVTLTSVADDHARLERLLQGRTDICLRLPDERVAEVRAAPGLRVELQPRLTVQMLSICPDAAEGQARKALADPRVRRAMLLASDRAGLVRRLLRGNATVAAQYVHPAVLGFDPELAPEPHDPARARSLLRDAGFAGGFAVEMGFSSGVTDVAGALVADLAAVGIAVTPVPLPFTELMERGRAHRLPLALHSWACVTGDAADFFDPLVRSRDPERGLGMENYSAYVNLEVDAVLDRAARETDRDRRLAYLQAAQRQVLADLPILPLTFRWWFIGLSDRVDIVVRHDTWLRVADYSWK